MQQETMAMVQGGLISTLIGGIFNGIWYYAFQRRDEQRDKLFENMTERIRRLEDEKIVGIQERLKSGADEFSDIHEDLDDKIKRPDFLLHQELCDRKFSALAQELKDVRTELLGVGKQVAAVSSVLNLIAAKLNISLPGVHHE